MIYEYNGIFDTVKKKNHTYKWNNMDEPQKYYAKWNKPDTKDYILYDSIIWNFFKTLILRVRAQYLPGAETGTGMTAKRREWTFLEDTNILEMYFGNNSTTM